MAETWEDWLDSIENLANRIEAILRRRGYALDSDDLGGQEREITTGDLRRLLIVLRAYLAGPSAGGSSAKAA
jgi:hypothetical protein